MNQSLLFAELTDANQCGPTVVMTSDEIQRKSRALQKDIDALERVQQAFDDQKISQEKLIAHCVNGIDLLRRYRARGPARTGTGRDHTYFRAEYNSRLSMLFLVISALIYRVKINYVARGWRAESRVETLRRYRGPCVEI